MKIYLDRFINWVKVNKITSIIIVILILLVGKKYIIPEYSSINYSSEASYGTTMMGRGRDSGIEMQDMVDRAPMAAKMIAPPVPGGESAPSTRVDRLIVRETSVSIVVKDVTESIRTMLKDVESLGGYLVTSNSSKPIEGGSGNLIVRVPVDRLDQALEHIRAQGIRVVNENISGTDVTDQYEDLDERLRILRSTKMKFEELYNSSKEVSDLLNLQREILGVQSQIDAIIGSQKYLTQTAKLARISIYLSTDELSLPYQPNNPWRPTVVFKYAVRSLMQNVQKLGSMAIWIGVYSIIWIPVLAIVYFVKKKLHK